MLSLEGNMHRFYTHFALVTVDLGKMKHYQDRAKEHGQGDNRGCCKTIRPYSKIFREFLRPVSQDPSLIIKQACTGQACLIHAHTDAYFSMNTKTAQTGSPPESLYARQCLLCGQTLPTIG